MEVSTKNLGKQLAVAEEITAAVSGAVSGPGKAEHPAQNTLELPLPEMPMPDIPETTIDSAELSNDSLSYNRDKEDEALRQAELDRLFSEVWDILEGWQSGPGISLDQELQKLKDIYQQLLQDIMKFYTRGQIGIQADRINGLLLEIIEKMGSSKFPNLLFLLDTYGKDAAGDFLRASILQKATGRTVSPKEVAALKAQGGHRQPSTRTGRPGAANVRYGLSGEDGILYDKGRGNRVNANQRYREHVQEEELFRFQSEDRFRQGHTENGIIKNGPFRLSKQNYSVPDIEIAERFLHYFNEQGNLYCHPELTAENEEFLGFLMAATMMKVRIFTDYSGIGKGMATDVRIALERLFQYQLEKNLETVQRNTQGSRERAIPDKNRIYRMYYRIMEIIQRSKAPGKGLAKGLQYAWEAFTASKENPEYQECSRYQQNAGFFTREMVENDKRNDLKNGTKLLDRDWQEFLASIGQDQNSLLQIALSNSLWGMLAEPEGPCQGGSSKKTAGAVFWGLAAMILLVLLAAAFMKITMFLH